MITAYLLKYERDFANLAFSAQILSIQKMSSKITKKLRKAEFFYSTDFEKEYNFLIIKYVVMYF